MYKIVVPAATRPVVDALRALIRSGAGASSSLATSVLVDLPVVWQRAGLDSSAAKRSHVFIAILHYVASQRLEGKDSQVALALFAFDTYAGAPIQDRYRAVAHMYNPYWSWENYRKEPLSRFLLAIALALEREAELAPTLPDFGSNPQLASTGRVGQDWVMEHYTAEYTFPGGPGEPLEVLQTRRLRAISQGVTMWRQGTYWHERGVSAQPDVVLYGAGHLSVVETHVDPRTQMRIFITEVRFDQPIAYGQTVEFTLLKRMATDYHLLTAPGTTDWYGLLTLPSPTDYARIGLRFPGGQRPSTLWRYEGVMNGLFHAGRPSPQTQITLDASGFVQVAWSELSAGYSYGISLGW